MSVKSYMIQKADKKWDTHPERLFRLFARSHNLAVVQNQSETFVFDDEPYTFQMDFVRPKKWEDYLMTGFYSPEEGFDVDFEIDGPAHDSEQNHRKDIWKDFVKAKWGIKVIHIPAVLCEKAWWPYLDKEIQKALRETSRSVWIVA